MNILVETPASRSQVTAATVHKCSVKQPVYLTFHNTYWKHFM